MRNLILGILILKQMTIYELRSTIRTSFSSMCSDSMGAIQAALKHLLADGLITVEARTEQGVHKKYYSVTDAGLLAFAAWVGQPLDVTRAKNQDLGRLLFMGLVPADERPALIKAVIEALEQELADLRTVLRHATEEQVSGLDPEYLAHTCTLNQTRSLEESMGQIRTFELLTLQLGIDTTEFHLQWFISLRDRIAEGRLP